jgi:hypothetical protein
MGTRARANIRIVRSDVGSAPPPIVASVTSPLAEFLPLLQGILSRKDLNIPEAAAVNIGERDRLLVSLATTGHVYDNCRRLLESSAEESLDNGETRRWISLPIYYRPQNLLLTLRLWNSSGEPGAFRMDAVAVPSYLPSSTAADTKVRKRVLEITTKPQDFRDPELLLGTVDSNRYNEAFRDSYLSPDIYVLLLRFLGMLDRDSEELERLVGQLRAQSEETHENISAVIVKSHGVSLGAVPRHPR